eukprot:55346-Amphidinium_carterae.1
MSLISQTLFRRVALRYRVRELLCVSVAGPLRQPVSILQFEPRPCRVREDNGNASVWRRCKHAVPLESLPVAAEGLCPDPTAHACLIQGFQAPQISYSTKGQTTKAPPCIN